MTSQQHAELNQLLRKLSLSSMNDCLSQRNHEAIANQMTYPEFLHLLAQDELLVRERRRYERRLKKQTVKGKKRLKILTLILIPILTRA